jgi:C1A family cysteine protease
MKKLLLILLCVPLIGFGQDKILKGNDKNKVKRKKYNVDGCIIDPEIEKKFKKEDIPIKKGDLSNAVSLKKYCPDVRSQGSVGSCTGWATTYAAFTIVRRIECKNNIGPFSPLSTYNKLKAFQNSFNIDCKSGTSPRNALNLLRSNGAPRFENYPNNCNLDKQNEKYRDRLYKFRTLNCSGELGVNNIKAALNNNEPVVIGMSVYKISGKGKSLSPKYISKSGEWTFITPNRKGYQRSSGHAMCIIGYDDSKFGGSFEVMNSWGDDWGDDGYFWVKYSDINTIDVAYSLIPGKCDKNLVIPPIVPYFPEPPPRVETFYEWYKDFYKKHKDRWWINNFRFSYSIVGGWNADYVRTGNPNKIIYSNDNVHTNRLSSYAQYGYQLRTPWWNNEEFGIVSKLDANLGAILKKGPTLFESSLALGLTKDDLELGYGVMWSFGEFTSAYSFSLNNSQNINYSLTFIPSEYGNRLMIGISNK